MPTKAVKVNVFRLVDASDRPVDLTGKLNDILSLQVDKRNHDYGDDVLRLHAWEASPSGRFDHGLLVRLRQNSDARKAHIARQEIGYITLAPGEVLSEWTYFIYAPETHTVIATINRFAASPEALAGYIAAKCDLSRLDVAYYPTGDLVERLYNLNEMEKIVFKIAVPENLDVFKELVLVPQIYAETLAQHRTHTVEVVMRAKSGGFETGIVGHVNKLVNLVGGQNHRGNGTSRPNAKLTVSGRKHDDTKDEINFVKDRLHSLATIEYKGKHPEHTNYWQALQDVYDTYRNQIRRWFPN